MITLKIQLTFPTDHEREMGQLLQFQPATDGHATDAISVSSNIGGYTPLTVVARYYRLPENQIQQLACKANEINEVGIYPFNKMGHTKYLMVVPVTKGQDSFETGKVLMNDLLAACAHCKVRNLHFYHYAMVLGSLNENEWRGIMAAIDQRKGTMDLNILIALDKNGENSFGPILNSIKSEFPDTLLKPNF